MELFFSKLLPQFIYPLGLAIWLTLLAGFLLLRDRNFIGGVCLAVAVVQLWLASMPIVAERLLARLEGQYASVAVADSPQADAVVLLGGAVGAAVPPRHSPDLSSAADRVLHAARLYRAGKVPRVIVSAGGIPWLGVGTTEGPALARLLKEWGVPEASIVVEDRSRNTYENAHYTKALIDEHGWKRVLLVTSALHMPRAMLIFTGVGIDAVPAPTDFQVVQGRQRTPLDWLPNAEALAATTRVVKEYLGLWWYRLRGLA